MNVMITGASGGLGRALAAECARRGYNIFLTDMNESGLKALQRGLERRFGACVTAKASDLTSAASVDGMLKVIDGYGIKFDMLLNVAGIDHEGGFLVQERENIAGIVSINNEAALRITHAVLSRRRPGGHFTVIFVSSLASMFPMPLKATYAASKRFLLDFSVALGQELKRQDANALAVCPAGLATTTEAVRAIAAQGFWGNITTNKLELVSRRTIEKALRGRSVYIPGAVNRALSFFGALIPRAWVAAVIRRRWDKAQRRWA